MSAVLATPAPAPNRALPKGSNIGAVVIGGDYQGLGIVRSLGRKGIPVCVVDNEHSLSKFSRYTTKFVRVPNLLDERETVDTLLKCGERLNLQGWVLYPTRDETVAALSRYRAELATMFRVPTPEWSSVQWAWDKRNSYRLARKLQIPSPVTLYPETVEQLEQLSSLQPPFVVKPAIKEHFIYATKAKAWCANSHAELKDLFLKASDLLPRGEIMIQELIPGGGSQQYSYCAFFRDGQPVGKLVARRRRQHPLQFGRASTYVETVDIPEIEELSEKFLRAIDYYGLVEVEYKFDQRDGKYKLLDVNARTWGYHSIGSTAGFDFSYMLFRDQLGLPVSPSRARPGVGWMRITTDIPAACMAMLAKEIDVRNYIQSLKKCNTEAVFSTEDPLPGIAELFLLPYLAVKRGF
jgi:D-aspartate ligase